MDIWRWIFESGYQLEMYKLVAKHRWVLRIADLALPLGQLTPYRRRIHARAGRATNRCAGEPLTTLETAGRCNTSKARSPRSMTSPSPISRTRGRGCWRNDPAANPGGRVVGRGRRDAGPGRRWRRADPARPVRAGSPGWSTSRTATTPGSRPGWSTPSGSRRRPARRRRRGGTAVVLHAPEYSHGNLDWAALERSGQARLCPTRPPAAPPPPAAVVAPARDVQTFVPTQVVFDGMPNTRWWAFEDRHTNFGEVAADTTDVGKLMLIEFALIFANDWFVVPWTLPVGGLARVQGIAFSTVFDERLWIEPAHPGSRRRVGVVEHVLSHRRLCGPPTPQSELVLLPVAPKVLEGEPLEDLSLVRDEMANMVWAIEHQVPLPTGWPRSGHEAAHELRTFLQQLVGPPAGPPPQPAAPIRYQVMSSVPEQWLPFIPVHVDGSYAGDPAPAGSHAARSSTATRTTRPRSGRGPR